ncbi:MAG TPA: hypothetical protein EYP56_08325 [Planctomycetaceae bacterium]|nr:hypothetical protein [Planctomycetaceae bacterium]HIQ21406.1 hypothetical protein [Planctomycetota bacterium]
MKRIKWLLLIAVLAAGFSLAASTSAEAARVVIRTRRPRARVTYVYPAPRRIYYYGPVRVVPPAPPVVVYGPYWTPGVVVYGW